MRIFIRGGHNIQATGAKALIDEVTEDRKVTSSLVKYLNQMGYIAKDGSPGAMDSNSDLIYGVNQAVNFNADLFISVHFNKAYNSYNGAIGSEVLIHSQNLNSTDGIIAKRICSKLEEAGFKNRGIKYNDALYEMRVNKQKGIPAIIIEVCFVEATKDVELYKKLGPDYIGKILAEGIANKSSTNPPVNNTTSEIYRVRKTWEESISQKGAFSNLNNAIAECKKYDGYKVFNSKGEQIYPEVVSMPQTKLVSYYAEKGKATVTGATVINVRNSYKMENNDIVAKYNNGEIFYYDTVYITEYKNVKYIWCSYVSISGIRRYVCAKEGNNRYLTCV